METATMKNLLDSVGLATEEKAANELMASFLFDVQDDKIVIRANNSVIEGVYTYDGYFELEGDPITFCIERFIINLINKARTKKITFEFGEDPTDGNVTLRTGKTVHKLTLIDHIDFPQRLDAPSDKKLSEIEEPKNFVSAFKDSGFALSNLPGMDILKTFNIQDDKLSATNKAQAIFLEVDPIAKHANPPGLELLDVLNKFQQLDDDDKLYIYFDEDKIYVKFLMTTGVLEYSITIIEGEYPVSLEELLNDAEKSKKVIKFILEKDELIDALDTCLLYYDKAGTIGEVQFFTIAYKDKIFTFTTDIPTFAELNLELTPKKVKSKNDFEIHLDPKDLMDMAQLLEGNMSVVIYETLFTEGSPMAIVVYDTKDPSIKYLQVTMTKE